MSSSLLKGRNHFKPFTYQTFYDRWQTHEKSHWLPDEVSMGQDVVDWNQKLTSAQRDFLTNIFRWFTQTDVNIAGAYCTQYLPLFNLPEVRMMLMSFAAREAVHIDAYSRVIETVGMPETIYSDFLKYNEMKNKQEYLERFADLATNTDDPEHVATAIALFSAMTEGMALFSTFAMLLIFPLNGLMKGMGQIVSWSINDETQHVEGMIELFRVFVDEQRDKIDLNKLRFRIETIAREMTALEFAFIDLVFGRFSEADLFGVSEAKFKLYAEFIADHRLKQLGFLPIFNTSKSNPLPEIAVMINAPIHTNFFENAVTDYAQSALTGKWETDVWA